MVSLQIIAGVVSTMFLTAVAGAMAYLAFCGPSPDLGQTTQDGTDASTAD